jgi:WD40 repeat protein
VKVWDVESGALLQSYAGPSGEVHDTAWSPDGRFIAAAAATRYQINDGGVYIWDARSAAVAATVTPTTPAGSYALAFSADGKYLAYGDNTTLTVVPVVSQ